MIPGDYTPINGTAIKLVSLTGQLIQYIRNSDNTGDGLSCKVETLKNGGTNSIEFSVDRRSNIPVFPGLIIEVYKDGEIFAIGYSNTIPKPQSDSPELVVQAFGYMHKLATRVVNKTYASATLSAIIADLESDFNLVDIFYDVSKITLPATTVTNLVFDDKTLREVIDTILQIANEDYNNAQYRWFIDTGRKINFELISNTSVRGLYEGFNYQAPEVEEEEQDIVNRVLAYKTDQTNTKELIYVAQYDDTDSQGKYGIRDRKIVFPDFMDNITMGKFIAAIIQKDKDPKTKVLIEDLEGVNYPFGFYKLSDRSDLYWQLLSECDSFDGWDISAAVDTTVVLSTEQVLTGRRSIKATTKEGSLNEFIQYNTDSPIFAPQLFRFFLYLEEQMSFEVSLIDTNDVEYTFELGSAELKLEANQTVSIVKKLSVYTGLEENTNTAYEGSNFGGSNYG